MAWRLPDGRNVSGNERLVCGSGMGFASQGNSSSSDFFLTISPRGSVGRIRRCAPSIGISFAMWRNEQPRSTAQEICHRTPGIEWLRLTQVETPKDLVFITDDYLAVDSGRTDYAAGN